MEMTTAIHNQSSFTTASSGSETSSNGITSLYPAIIQCFGIILLGYITVRAGWITSTQAKGLNFFTTKFALPALLFSNMAVLDWSEVEWLFLCAIFICKAGLFLILVIFTLVIRKPVNLGLAGLVGIFVTQSNDFALGYPIVKAIYGETQPQLLQYIYLIAPISFLILNPIGFVLLEIEKVTSSSQSSSKLKIAWKTAKEVATNPLIVMTAAGVAANFIFNHSLPLIISEFLNTLGQSFSACALFILGMNIVGKFKRSMDSVMAGCGLLLFSKLLVFPVLCMVVTRGLGCGSATNSTRDYAMFAFLYGTFPTAPSVFLYASQYSVGMDLVAAGLVLCTVASAPFMFVSAMVLGMSMFKLDVDQVLQDTNLDVAVTTITLLTCVLVLLFVTRRVFQVPHMMVGSIAFCQLLIAIAAIIDSSFPRPSDPSPMQWWEYLCFSVHTMGLLGVSMLTTATAAIMYLISCRSLGRALIARTWLLAYGFGCPLFFTGIILLLGGTMYSPTHDIIMYGHLQRYVVSGCITINVIVSVTLLIVRHRHCHLIDNNKNDPERDSLISSTQYEYNRCYNSIGSRDSEANIEATINLTTSGDVDFDQNSNTDTVAQQPIQTGSLNPDKSACNETCQQRSETCRMGVEGQDRSSVDGDDITDTTDDITDTNSDSSKGTFQYQMERHLALLVLILLTLTMVVLFDASSLFLPDLIETGTYVELEFISVVSTTGQGILTFLIFGLDSTFVLIPLKNTVLRLLRAIHVNISRKSNPSEEAIKTCQQFMRHHKENCLATLETRRCRNGCFTGQSMAAWLLDAGLAADDAEVYTYASQLIEGYVLTSCERRNRSVFFNTERHYYYFTDQST